MEFFTYLLKSSGLLVLFLVIYELFLQKETFYKVNRAFLLIGILIATILPALTFEQTEIILRKVKSTTLEGPGVSEMMLIEPATAVPNPSFWETISLSSVLFFIYLGVVLVLGIHFFIRLFQLGKILNKPVHTQVEKGFHYIKTSQRIGAFSFFNRIVFNPSLYPKQELNLILKHEEAHAKGWHSLDVLLANLLVILNWFNPFILIYQKRMLENLEFIADSEATQTLASPKPYQLALLKAASGQPIPYPVTSFKNSFTASRIKKLTQVKSPKTALWKLGLILPLLAGFFFAFQIETKAEIRYITEESEINATEGDTLAANSRIAFILDATTQKEELAEFQKTLKEDFDLDFEYQNYRKNQAGEVIDLTITVSQPEGRTLSVKGHNEGKPIKTIGFRAFHNPGTQFKLWVMGKEEVFEKSKRDQLSSKLSEYLKKNEYLVLNGQKTAISALKNKVFPLKDLQFLEKNGQKQLSIEGEGLKADRLKRVFLESGFEHSHFVFFKANKEKITPLIFFRKKGFYQDASNTPPPPQIREKKTVDPEEISISPETNEQDLKDIQKLLKTQHGLDFGFGNLRFDQEGYLTQIHLWFVDRDGKKHESTILGTQRIPTISLLLTGAFKGFKIHTKADKSEFLKRSSSLIINGKPDEAVEHELEEILKKQNPGHAMNPTGEETKSVQLIKSINVIKGDEKSLILINDQTLNDDFQLQITQTTSDADLEKLKRQFESKNVDFTYRVRRKSGIITKIKVKLDDGAGKTSSSNYQNNQGISPFTIGYTHDKFYIR